MLKKATLGAVLAVLGMFIVTAQVVSPQAANADDAVPVTTFSAGNALGPICNCPVLKGNCVCAFTQ